MALPRRENAFAHGQLMGKGYKDQEERKIATVTRNTIVTWLKNYTFTLLQFITRIKSKHTTKKKQIVTKVWTANKIELIHEFLILSST